jgi:hypothetical protein
LVKKVETLQQLKGLKGVLLAAGETLKGKLSVYPPQKSLTRTEVYGQPFKTEKQRRYFFYALGKGLITVPYSRGADPKSERFKASWAIETLNDGLTVVVGNDTTYGPYLMGNKEQSKFAAAIGWPTVDAVMDANAEEISRFAVYQLERIVGA